MKNLFVISNDSIDKKDNHLFTNSSDLDNILEAFSKKKYLYYVENLRQKKIINLKKKHSNHQFL